LGSHCGIIHFNLALELAKLATLYASTMWWQHTVLGALGGLRGNWAGIGHLSSLLGSLTNTQWLDLLEDSILRSEPVQKLPSFESQNSVYTALSSSKLNMLRFISLAGWHYSLIIWRRAESKLGCVAQAPSLCSVVLPKSWSCLEIVFEESFIPLVYLSLGTYSIYFLSFG
jgi:hypothetical protein